MKVSFRFLCKEIVGNVQNGEYELPEGCTVSEAFEIINDGSFVDDYLRFMLIMKNSRASKPDDVLTDGDTVMVLRKVHGG